MAWLLTRFEVPKEGFDELRLGLLSDLEPADVADVDELMVYCRRVAGVVGWLVAPICGYRGGRETLDMALALGNGPYSRPFAGENYLYFRAQQQDAFGIVYFQPAVFALANLDDGSFQLTPELDYTGFKNVELRLRLYLLHGKNLTDFGEKPNERKVEAYARFYF